MAIELVTGHTGTEHVTAAQAGLANAGVAGTGMYVLDVLQKFECTVASANSVTIGTGMARINGRDVASESATSLSVANGVSGQNRRDLVVARYSKATSTGVESVSLAVIKGTATTGTPSDPAYNTGSIIDGKTTVDMPLWRLPITGVSVGTPVQLFTVLPSLKALGDSVSPTSQVVTSSDPKVSVYGCRRFGSVVFVWGSVDESEAGWISASLSGLPKPPGKVGVTIGRTNYWDNAQSSASIDTDGTFIEIVYAAGNSSRTWSATYVV